jgi:hypothetical protein
VCPPIWLMFNVKKERTEWRSFWCSFITNPNIWSGIIITSLVDADENMCKKQNTDSECHSEKINVGSSYKRVVLRPLLEYL